VNENERTSSAPVWRPAWVWIDGYSPAFAAQVHATERWNGWACPRFARIVAQQVASWVVAQPEAGYTGRWWWADLETQQPDVAGMLLVLDRDADHYAEPDLWEPDGDGMWPIGAWSWVWRELDADEVEGIDHDPGLRDFPAYAEPGYIEHPRSEG